jgi:hypothetical protein
MFHLPLRGDVDGKQDRERDQGCRQGCPAIAW